MMQRSNDLLLHGKALYMEGNLLDAASCFETALINNAESAQSFSNLLLTLNYLPEYDNETLTRLHSLFEVRFCKSNTVEVASHANTLDPERRLRIGYVSPDFRGHSVAFFIAPVLMQHDQQQFEIFAYYNHQQNDNITENLSRCCNQWRNIAGLPDNEAANLIRQDGIDILIDLAGHSAHNRLLTFAKKPAPIQITWLGYPNTTGLSCMDYRLTNTLTDPVCENGQTGPEEPFHLPDTFFCYSPLRKCPDISPLPALANGYITFGSLNNFVKLSPEVIMTWIQLLKNLPDSRLHLIYNGGDKAWLDRTITEATSCDQIPFSALRAMGNYLHAKKTLTSHGIEKNRIAIFGRSPSNAAHMQHYRDIDIALDPFPYNGTTTTMESFWMGVPVISLRGNRHAARVSANISTHISLDELVGKDYKSYISAALKLAADKGKLAALRASLRNTMSSSCLMDTEKFTRNIEVAYRTIWKRLCNV
jgi:predicted O-linked N-acetylglucosamine transferase (SPINDLY family)